MTPPPAWRWVQEPLDPGEPDEPDDPNDPAGPDGALGLRARGPLTPALAAAGWTALEPGGDELARPVPLVLADRAATRALGARLASLLRPGDLVVLTGPLGAGKTALTQGLGQALGVRGAVTSPTFVLAREHRGPLPMVHVDAYRLRAPDGSTTGAAAALLDLDLEGALEVGVVVVEWGAGVVEDVSASRLEVVLDRPGPVPPSGQALDTGTAHDGDERRTAAVHAHGPRWSAVQAP